jgi:RNA-binding protein YlmH
VEADVLGKLLQVRLVLAAAGDVLLVQAVLVMLEAFIAAKTVLYLRKVQLVNVYLVVIDLFKAAQEHGWPRRAAAQTGT